MSDSLKNVIFFDCSDPQNLKTVSHGKIILPIVGSQFSLQGDLVEVCYIGPYFMGDFQNIIDVYSVWFKPCKK